MVYGHSKHSSKRGLKPFVWKVADTATPEGNLERLEADPVKENLSGQIRGVPASDLEERVYVGLVTKFGDANIEFQPSYLGAKNLTEVRPDFAVHGQGRIIVIFVDGEFTHMSAADQAHDAVNDARLMAEMSGEIDQPVHIPERDIPSVGRAIGLVEELF